MEEPCIEKTKLAKKIAKNPFDIQALREKSQLTLDSSTGVNPVHTHGIGLWGNPRVVFGVRVDKGLKKQFNLASQALFGSTCNPVECFMASVVGVYQNQELLRVNPSNTINIGEIKIERNLRERRKLVVDDFEMESAPSRCEIGDCKNVASGSAKHLATGAIKKACKWHLDGFSLFPKDWRLLR